MPDPIPLLPVPPPVLAQAGTTRRSRLLARLLSVGVVIVALSMLIFPWQQSVRGVGRVIAFNPLDRRANIEAPVEGRVKRLHVVENQAVRQGDLIAEIQDNDPNLLLNLRLQHDAAVARRAAAEQRIRDIDEQIESQELAKPQALDAAAQRVNAEQVVFDTGQINARRMEELLKTDDISKRDWELAKLTVDSAKANLAAAKAVLERTARDYDAIIASSKASRGLAEADLAAAVRDISAVDILISKSEQQIISAPRDGIILSVSATEGAYLKPGSSICVLIPQTEERFVEAWIDGMDMPLVAPTVGTLLPSGLVGQVRLQFEGWPAIQFVGWPSVAVGTFGGRIMSIDAVDDGAGRFRIVICPDKSDAPWPSAQFLRQGVRTKAWVLLQTVPLWQEVWRQLNGFPPVFSPSEPKAQEQSKAEL